MKKLAFTLTELLIALSIIGTIAVLTIPKITGNTFQKANIAKLQATIKEVQEAAKLMMVEERVTSIADTSFNDYSASNHSDFYTKYLKPTKVCNKKDDCAFFYENRYKAISANGNTFINNNDMPSMLLPSGVALRCYTVASGSGNNTWTALNCEIDVNGIEAPNIIGRDFFLMQIADDGSLADFSAATKDGCTEGSAWQCLGLLMQNDWDPDYSSLILTNIK